MRNNKGANQVLANILIWEEEEEEKNNDKTKRWLERQKNLDGISQKTKRDQLCLLPAP